MLRCEAKARRMVLSKERGVEDEGGHSFVSRDDRRGNSTGRSMDGELLYL